MTDSDGDYVDEKIKQESDSDYDPDASPKKTNGGPKRKSKAHAIPSRKRVASRTPSPGPSRPAKTPSLKKPTNCQPSLAKSPPFSKSSRGAGRLDDPFFTTGDTPGRLPPTYPTPWDDGDPAWEDTPHGGNSQPIIDIGEHESGSSWAATNGRRKTRRPVRKLAQPRKARMPRPKLMKWTDDDWKLAMLCLVHVCGEMNNHLPFEETARMINPNCSGSALQQALLKLKQKFKDEDKYCPDTLTMSWSKNKAATSRGHSAVAPTHGVGASNRATPGRSVAYPAGSIREKLRQEIEGNLENYTEEEMIAGAAVVGMSVRSGLVTAPHPAQHQRPENYADAASGPAPEPAGFQIHEDSPRHHAQAGINGDGFVRAGQQHVTHQYSRQDSPENTTFQQRTNTLHLKVETEHVASVGGLSSSPTFATEHFDDTESQQSAAQASKGKVSLGGEQKNLGSWRSSLMAAANGYNSLTMMQQTGVANAFQLSQLNGSQRTSAFGNAVNQCPGAENHTGCINPMETFCVDADLLGSSQSRRDGGCFSGNHMRQDRNVHNSTGGTSSNGDPFIDVTNGMGCANGRGAIEFIRTNGAEATDLSDPKTTNGTDITVHDADQDASLHHHLPFRMNHLSQRDLADATSETTNTGQINMANSGQIGTSSRMNGDLIGTPLDAFVSPISSRAGAQASEDENADSTANMYGSPRRRGGHCESQMLKFTAMARARQVAALRNENSVRTFGNDLDIAVAPANPFNTELYRGRRMLTTYENGYPMPPRPAGHNPSNQTYGSHSNHPYYQEFGTTPLNLANCLPSLFNTPVDARPDTGACIAEESDEKYETPPNGSHGPRSTVISVPRDNTNNNSMHSSRTDSNGFIANGSNGNDFTPNGPHSDGMSSNSMNNVITRDGISSYGLGNNTMANNRFSNGFSGRVSNELASPMSHIGVSNTGNDNMDEVSDTNSFGIGNHGFTANGLNNGRRLHNDLFAPLTNSTIKSLTPGFPGAIGNDLTARGMDTFGAPDDENPAPADFQIHVDNTATEDHSDTSTYINGTVHEHNIIEHHFNRINSLAPHVATDFALDNLGNPHDAQANAGAADHDAVAELFGLSDGDGGLNTNPLLNPWDEDKENDNNGPLF
ncbi:hypothetical protein GQ43DRAFT_246763 [Delitschia confertaspora ATCC 74209]|uniref:Uncharacterized protein n=1 Tax=Delitschia confertaspora ATCC 74209 TaxID=1513339 RepID=A0A9P4MUJ1_9PLEO|nr:hypothetical protein GQ43DRAFT_246763 [Delitschia confertaspora ATCC 74209]